jgi:hypothetical protein
MKKHRHLIVIGLLWVIAGCTPWATYPPIEGAIDISRPGLRPIPDLMASSIWHVYDSDGRVGQIVFNLPEFTPASVYDSVIVRLDGAEPMRYPDQQAIHVAEVRVRAMEAEVDVIHLGEGGVPELITLGFKKNLLDGYRVASERPWRIRVDMPPPHYVPDEEPPDVEVATHSDDQS